MASDEIIEISSDSSSSPSSGPEETSTPKRLIIEISSDASTSDSEDDEEGPPPELFSDGSDPSRSDGSREGTSPSYDQTGRSTSNSPSPAPDFDADDPLAAVWQRELACDILPSGTAPAYNGDAVLEAMGTNAPWYSLQELLTLRQESLNRDPQDTWHIPSSLIWKTLITLLTDAHLLHTGGERYKNGPEGWQPILHNSIHPGNIWFERIPPGENGPFGRCVLGRMTRCLILPRRPLDGVLSDDERMDLRREFRQLPLEYDARWYEAPEVRQSLAAPTTSGSDVWSIGAVIMSMMMGVNMFEAAAERIRDRRENSRADVAVALDALGSHPVGRLVGNGELSDVLPYRFCTWLRMRVEQMLVPEPSQRPCAVHLLDQAHVMFGIVGSQREEDVGDRKTWMRRGLRMAR